MLHYPLLRYFSPDSRLAWRDRQGISAAQFLAAAEALAAELPAHRFVVNLCHDRYNFLLGFAAALLARQVSLLPNSHALYAIRQLRERYADAYYLTDHAQIPDDAPVYVLPGPPDPSARRPHAGVPTIPADQTAAIVFTSGSTGQPSPHTKTWGSLVKGAEALGWQFGLGRQSPRVVIGTVPPQHMYGLETTVMLPLRWGWIVDAGRPVFPKDLRLALEEHSVPVWLMTTPLHLRACATQRMPLPNLEGIISSTMPLPLPLAQQAEAFLGIPVHEIYGCTEGGILATRRTTLEKSWKLCEGIRIWQEQQLVWVEGGHVGPPLKLADAITVETDGRFLLHGRTGDFIKIAGRRASLDALNAALTGVDGVLDGMFYVPDHTEQTGKERLAAVAVAPGRTASSILADLRQHIDPVFLPRPLRVVESLPRSATGKVPRESLRALMGARGGIDPLTA